MTVRAHCDQPANFAEPPAGRFDGASAGSVPVSTDDWKRQLADSDLLDQAKPWLIPRDPKRLYVFFPQEKPTEIQPTELAEILNEHAEQLFQAAQKEAAEGDPSTAFRMLHEVLFFDPNHASARRILGHRAQDDGSWHIASDRLRSRLATLFLRRLKQLLGLSRFPP